MNSPGEPGLELRGRTNCHYVDGTRLHSLYRIFVPIDGKPKALSFPSGLAAEVRKKN
jgi:hypothetical protein